MKPTAARNAPRAIDGLLLAACGLLLAGIFSIGGGCSALDMRSQSPEDEVEKLGSSVKLIGDMAIPFGMTPIHVESVGLVSGLPGTGSDPGPSPQRAALMAEMQTRGVVNPNALLSSNTTELVLVHAVLHPGIQKGDRFDVEIRVPSKSEGTSLRGGWLMEARMREMAVLGNQVHEGKALALAQGPVLVDPSGKDKIQRGRGRILRGGVALTTRDLGLVIRPEDRNFMTSAQIGTAINRRFHSYEGGIKQGVAKPKTDEFIELKIHASYKDNIERYMRVVRAIPLRETPQQQQARLTLLERQLLDPITSASAALRLEALGAEGIETLRKGLAAKSEEVRFYACESLAYLDVAEAAAPLGQLARDVPAFRAYALAALSTMQEPAANEALHELLDAQSVETRYGAFRALWAMDARDPLVRGEELAQQFSYHVLDTKGPPMVHVTGSYRAEVVVFGQDQALIPPIALEAGPEITINSLDDERVSVTRFSVGQPDQKRVVSNKLDDVIRAIVDLGGTYPDVVQALQTAKSSGSLAGRFEVDALPRGHRRYVRKSETEVAAAGEEDSDASSRPLVSSPLSDLYDKDEAPEKPRKKLSKPRNRDDSTSNDRKDSRGEDAEKPQSLRSLFVKMVNRDD